MLFVGGAVSLAVGSFNITQETHEALLGPITVTVWDQYTATVPIWVGFGGMVLGLLFLLLAARRN